MTVELSQELADGTVVRNWISHRKDAAVTVVTVLCKVGEKGQASAPCRNGEGARRTLSVVKRPRQSGCERPSYSVREGKANDSGLLYRDASVMQGRRVKEARAARCRRTSVVEPVLVRLPGLNGAASNTVALQIGDAAFNEHILSLSLAGDGSSSWDLQSTRRISVEYMSLPRSSLRSLRTIRAATTSQASCTRPARRRLGDSHRGHPR